MKLTPPKYLILLVSFVVLLLGWVMTPHKGHQITPMVAETAAKPVNREAAPQTVGTRPAGIPPAASSAGTKSRELFQVLGRTTGQPLEPKSAAFVQAKLDGHTPVGRITPLNTSSLAVISTLRRGDRVSLPLSDHEAVEAVVNLAIHEADGTVRIGGSLTGKPGTFSLAGKDAGLTGLIQLPQEGLAYRIEPGTAGATVLNEVLLSDVICSPTPPMQDDRTRPEALAPEAAPPPVLNSRPTAVAQIYLDFDGETVTDPSWNSGNTIVAAAYTLTDTEITTIFERVKEDFWPFNINLTTDVAKYNSAPVGQRMRCIITPTKAWHPGAGGVAYLKSFAESGGMQFSSTIPCWVFNSTVVGISEAVSHEVGHTFGLSHDGRTDPVEDYFSGHGAGATSSGPIMGACYNKNVVQWSKGVCQCK